MFIAINILVSLFFLFLVYLGIRFRVFSFIPVNILGFIVAIFAIIYEIQQQQYQFVTLFMMILLLVVFASDFIISLSRITEIKFLSVNYDVENLYLKIEKSNHEIKLIGSAAFIQKEFQQHFGFKHSVRMQAFDLWLEGNYALAKNDFLTAIEKFQTSLKCVPSLAASLNLAGAFLLTNQVEMALETCGKILEEDNNFGAAWINKSIAKKRLRQFNEAVVSLEHAARAGEKPEEISILKGNIFIQESKMDAALEAFDSAILSNPAYAYAWYQKGLCLVKTGKQTEATHCFAKAVELDPNHYWSWYCQGNVYNRQEKYESAISNYEKALELNPDFNEAWNNKGIALCRLGRFREGLKCYDRALKIKPNYFEAWINQGLAYEDSGAYDHAIFSYQKFIDLAPNSMSERITTTKRRVVELQETLKQNSMILEKKALPPNEHNWQASNFINV